MKKKKKKKEERIVLKSEARGILISWLVSTIIVFGICVYMWIKHPFLLWILAMWPH